jgi:hypothetical protein
MKFLVSILSVYIVLLSTTICCQESYAMADFGNHTEQHEAGALPHDDCAGVCSPFCLCATCTGFTVEPVFPYYQTKPQELSSEIRIYTQQIYTSSLVEGIWQPPKRNYEL